MYKEFRIELDRLEKLVHDNKNFTKYRWDTMASICSNSNRFTFFSQLYFHSIEMWTYQHFVSWLNTLGGINFLINAGYSSDKSCRYEILLDELQEIFIQWNIPFNGSLTHRAKGQFRKDRRHYKGILKNRSKVKSGENF